MGTSTGYQMPTGGDWTPLKTDATNFVQNGTSATVTPQSLLGDYMRAIGGAAAFSSGGGGSPSGSGGGGGAGGGGASGGGSSSGSGGSRSVTAGGTRAAQRVTHGLGNFLARVGSAGIGEALRDIGLGELVGKSASEIATALLDKLAGPSSTIDDAAARAACDDLNKELLQDARTTEDVDRVFKTAMDDKGLGGILMRFFSLYIYRRFCRDFYENWCKRAGNTVANARLSTIKKFIDTNLKARCINKNITATNWKGGEGGRLVSQILGETCRVFEVGS